MNATNEDYELVARYLDGEEVTLTAAQLALAEEVVSDGRGRLRPEADAVVAGSEPGSDSMVSAPGSTGPDSRATSGSRSSASSGKSSFPLGQVRGRPPPRTYPPLV